MKSITFVLLLYLFAFTSCSKEENQTYENQLQDVSHTATTQSNAIEETFLNVPYGIHEQQVLDLYLPQGRTTQATKVLIVVHGGGWVNGDKNSFTNFVLALKENNPNHAIVNINYVLGTEDHFAFPNQFLDIKSIVNFIKERKNEYQIKPEFGLIGSSAGGHLALQYTYKYDTDNDVKFVASLGGPTNFLDPFYQDNVEELTDLLVDKNHYQNTILDVDENTNIDFLKILSPTFEITTHSSPTLLIYGNQDTVVPISNGIAIDKDLKNNNIESYFHIINGGHGEWNSAEQIEATHILLTNFIDNHLYVSE